MKLPVHKTTGKSSSLTVSADLFDQPLNPTLLAQAVRVYLSNLRQGTSKTKTRGEVARVKAKWYRQKGTGNARHGSRNAPIFVGGSVAHGPRGIENWTKTLSQKQKQKALVVALSAQAKKITICDDFEKLSGKTKAAAELIQAITPEKKILIIVEKTANETVRSTNNLPNVLLTKSSRVNALEVVTADAVIITQAALKALESRIVKPIVKPGKPEVVSND